MVFIHTSFTAKKKEKKTFSVYKFTLEIKRISPSFGWG